MGSPDTCALCWRGCQPSELRTYQLDSQFGPTIRVCDACWYVAYSRWYWVVMLQEGGRRLED